ncbi:AraC family transcriptional regulator [Limnobacter sp.]|uniref:AraC family transcriptional regulator n=1 Tax=Limnobacter sp. TaxID=2003368 RepID=UPI0035182792
MNSFAPARRSIASAKILCDLGQELGSNRQALLMGSGILPAQLDDPHVEISPDQELQIIHNLVRLHPHVPGLGLQAGARYHLNTYGIWGYALITSPNFQQAIELGLRYLDLTFAFARVSMSRQAGVVFIELAVDHLPPSVRGFIVERDASAIQVLQQALFGKTIPLIGMEFSVPPSAPVSEYREVFGCEPRFGQPVSRASFSDTWLALRLPSADPDSAKACEAQLEELLSRRQKLGGVSAWLRNKLIADLANAPNLEQIASDNFMTERTLRRRLTEEGTSYRDILSEVRQAMAEELLCRAHLSVAEVSSRLGYASSSAFIHAFQKWHNCSPRQFLDARSEQIQRE